MKREKEITKEAKKFAKEIDDWEIAEDVQDAFEQGALWADEHPSLHVVASLMHLLRSGRIDTTTTNADVLTQLQIELKNRDKTNQSKAL